MSFQSFIQAAALRSLQELYGETIATADFQVTVTKPEFTGDYTIVFFPLLKKLKLKPEELGNTLGSKITALYHDAFSSFNVLKGFLNLELADKALQVFLEENYQNESFGKKAPIGETVMIEYASPNTNKPLHLGHLRNIFLGWSMSQIFEANGFEVIKSSIINDRGIHICKSMIAWQLFAEGATPESSGKKGDHFVGDYYVKFNDAYQQQVADLVTSGIEKAIAEKEAPIMKQAQEMLRKWEDGDIETRSLWAMMNGWVYKGFDTTYDRIGIAFDKVYYESDTYLLGKEYVQEGLDRKILFKKVDNSVWINLEDSNLEEKLLLRGNGTSVYITQDIGLAIQKFEQYPIKKSMYVIGDEQLHHMKVLKEICRKLGFPFANDIYHLSYGMVELTTGKMKSREGTVVDADDIIQEMSDTAAAHTAALGKVEGSSDEELLQLYDTLGQGAMKFYLLRVDPKKRMVFNPEESIDFHGYTGPFVQYTYARIKSILRKTGYKKSSFQFRHVDEKLQPLERNLVLILENFTTAIGDAAREMNPSIVANYAFNLARAFNSFYAEHSVLQAESEHKKNLRIALSLMTAYTIETSLKLLGIRVPERM